MSRLLLSTLILVPLAFAALAVFPSGGAANPDGVKDMIPVDTSGLMGSPEPILPYDFEPAFPDLQFDRPLAFTHAGDGSGRAFVVEQDGTIRVFPNRRDVKPQHLKTFLDLREVVTRADNELGLLGLAFHPSYRTNGQFFVFYSHKEHASVLSRFTVSRSDPDRADRSSEEVLLRIPKRYPVHNGGSIEFGPDGFLYAGVGDGGAARDAHGNGQSLETLKGKVLRLDVNRRDPGRKYAIPKDNPFVARGPKVRGEIWAYGLRNPWRLSFDPRTGTCWCGDVGESDFEEINVITKGGNYGWSLREGRHPFGRGGSPPRPDLIDPIWEYPHTEGRAVTGGVVYRGKRLPKLEGAYLFADYIIGNIWALWYDGKKVTKHAKLSGREQHGITSFGYDSSGEAYFTAFDGKVYRLREASWAKDLEKPFPAKLSQTALFTDLKRMTPTPGLIPYSINVPLWSDHADKERFIVLPARGQVRFSEKDKWEFPAGTVFVKTFFLDLTRSDPRTRRRLETRLLVRHRWGWEGYTYLWNNDDSEAELHLQGLKRPYPVRENPGDFARAQSWHFPSHSECKSCHTRPAKYVLGLSTRQMNRPHEKTGVNQVTMLARMGAFSSEVPDPQSLEKYPDWQTEPEWHDREALQRRARAYLDANCAHCHAPGGTANQSKPDLRFHTALERTNLIGEPPERGRLGPPDSRLICPGDPLRSELWLRVKTTSPSRMPMVASSLPDHRAVEVLGRWIEGMGPRGEQTGATSGTPVGWGLLGWAVGIPAVALVGLGTWWVVRRQRRGRPT